MYFLDRDLPLPIYYESCGFTLAVIDNFSFFRYPVLLRNYNAQTFIDPNEFFLRTSKVKLNSFESDDEKEIVTEVLNDFLQLIKIKKKSRCSSKGALVVNYVKGISEYFLENGIYGTDFAKIIVGRSSVTKQYY